MENVMINDNGFLTLGAVSEAPIIPRICMPTARNFTRRLYQCGLYEAQDVLSEIDNVDLIHLDPGATYQLREKYQKRLIWHDFTKKLAYLNPGLRTVRLNKEYDLFVAVCQDFTDLRHINAIKEWKKNCRTTICWIDEFWINLLPGYKNWMCLLDQFDHIVFSLHDTVAAVSDLIGRKCHYVPGGVDAIRFNPHPNPPSRVIDLYSIGRKWEGVHSVLQKLAAQKNFFYIYDTFSASDAQAQDHRQHRELLANMAKRSRYFLVGPAKMDMVEESRDQVEIGYRYYEGAAAGAILIGQVPHCTPFHEMFSWPDAVIEIKTNGSDVVEVLSCLSAQPERLHEISRRNAMEALLRLDWVYRWKQILEIAGLKPTPAMDTREKRLKQLAGYAKFDGNIIQ